MSASGSSIKGALRTASLWSAIKKPLVGFPHRDKEVTEWERVQLGSRSKGIQNDLKNVATKRLLDEIYPPGWALFRLQPA